MLSKTRHVMLLALLGLALGSCEALNAPNFNAGELSELQNNPTRASIGAAVTGMTITTRKVYGEDDNDMVAMLGILGRENYVLDVADPRFVSEMLGGDLNAASPAFGGNFWSRPYQNVRLADVILSGVEALSSTEMSDAEKAATRGFVKTWKALDLLVVVQTRDTNCDASLGCPIAVEEDPEDLATALSKQEVYEEIERLLDAGLTDLGDAGGAAFPFDLHAGFGEFANPAAFTEFNRALAARVDVYMAGEFGDPTKFNEALTNLNQSFMDTTMVLTADPLDDLGVYHVYSTGSGDVSNGLFQPSDDPNFRAHSSFRDSARLQSDGTTLDQRFLAKSRPVTFRTFQQVGSDIGISTYASAGSPIPIIRNEELILLAAEAHVGLGDLATAEEFLNQVRVESGGLPEVDLSSMSPSAALSELLYDKRYSLWAEGGHHWIDMRRYGRLDDIPLDLSSHQVNARYPIPIDEQLARGEGG